MVALQLNELWVARERLFEEESHLYCFFILLSIVSNNQSPGKYFKEDSFFSIGISSSLFFVLFMLCSFHLWLIVQPEDCEGAFSWKRRYSVLCIALRIPLCTLCEPSIQYVNCPALDRACCPQSPDGSLHPLYCHYSTLKGQDIQLFHLCFVPG